MAIKEKVQFFKKNFQIIYSIVLIVFIPLAIIINTVIFTESFKKAIDQEMYSKVIDIGNTINANILELIANPEELQKRVMQIADFNDNIASLDILSRAGDQFKVVASLDEKTLGNVSKDFSNVLAWNQVNPVAYLTNSANKSTVNENINFKKETNRYWVVVMPLKDQADNRIGLISMKVSLEVMDSLTKQILIRSYFILLVTILIIVLLLANNTRLFEYAALYRKIKEVDQMKDEFISMASHELRTPVTGIRGYVSMILENTFGEINDKVRSSLQIVSQSAERLAILVDDLLNVSRIEQGRIEVKSVPTDITEIIKSIVNELKVQADNKKLSLSFKPHAASLPLISIDVQRLKQILINLIGNSIKYTPSGSVEITTEEKNNGKDLEIRIKDTGIGMSAKERERLFEKFYRVENSQTKTITGTGLGLWITKQLVILMKGQIMVDSIEGVGTQMTLIFPIIK